MRYNNIVEGKFLSRPNRFIANVEINGKTETVHVKNTGRCRELLVPNATVFLEKSDNPLRKTQYDLVAVYKDNLLKNMDSQIPNDVAFEWLKLGDIFSKDAKIRREVTHNKSRFDFYIEDGNRKIFLEVKGCTLEQDGIAMFPDAPTERGVKHIEELIDCVSEGFEAYILFVIQMKGPKIFKPNDNTHKAFGDALRKASQSGVRILAYNSIVTENSIKIDKEVKIEL